MIYLTGRCISLVEIILVHLGIEVIGTLYFGCNICMLE